MVPKNSHHTLTAVAEWMIAQDKADKSPAMEIHAGLYNSLLPIGIILRCYSCTFLYSRVPNCL